MRRSINLKVPNRSHGRLLPTPATAALNAKLSPMSATCTAMHCDAAGVKPRTPKSVRGSRRAAVEHLSRGEIAEGVVLLEQQGRVTEIADAQQRIAAIARSYAACPENTIVVSPDNASRRQINQAVRSELQALGTVASEDHAMRVLAPRSDMTGADRTWAARYAVDDVLYYPRGSHDIGIEKQSYVP
jgi:hypothetical protein